MSDSMLKQIAAAALSTVEQVSPAQKSNRVIAKDNEPHSILLSTALESIATGQQI